MKTFVYNHLRKDWPKKWPYSIPTANLDMYDMVTIP